MAQCIIKLTIDLLLYSGILYGNDSHSGQNDIQTIAQSGAQYINTNQTFLTKLYHLVLVPPEQTLSGAADTVYKGLRDSEFDFLYIPFLVSIVRETCIYDGVCGCMYGFTIV